MKAVIPVVLPDFLEERKRKGLDRYDEMWDGVLHMPPLATWGHQNLIQSLMDYLRRHWVRPQVVWIMPGLNLALPGRWPDDYRIPDLVLVTSASRGINRETHFEGPPDLVVEIRSPGDETYEKLPFYATLGVPEVWVIHCDTKEVEIDLLKRSRYRKVRAVSGGWVRSTFVGVEMRPGQHGKLSIRRIGEDATREELPQE